MSRILQFLFFFILCRYDEIGLVVYSVFFMFLAYITLLLIKKEKWWLLSRGFHRYIQMLQVAIHYCYFYLWVFIFVYVLKHKTSFRSYIISKYAIVVEKQSDQ